MIIFFFLLMCRTFWYISFKLNSVRMYFFMSWILTSMVMFKYSSGIGIIAVPIGRYVPSVPVFGLINSLLKLNGSSNSPQYDLHWS